MKNSIEWIILVTYNYQKAVSFYRDLLSFKVLREVVGEEFCQFKLNNCYLEYLGRSGGNAIYTLPESENIDKDYEILKSKGVNFIKTPVTQPWGQRTAYFTDPDGHIWEIQQWSGKVV